MLTEQYSLTKLSNSATQQLSNSATQQLSNSATVGILFSEYNELK